MQGLTDKGQEQTDLVIPATMTDGKKVYPVTGVNEYAFSQKGYPLKSIIMGENVKTIGLSAFAGISRLETVELNDDLEKIDELAFYGCTGMTSLYIGKNVTTINYGAFMFCKNMKEINYNAMNVKNFGDNVFKGCGENEKKLRLVIGDDVEIVPAHMFEGNRGLKTISINKSLTNIGDSAFKDCSSLNIINRSSEKATNEEPALTIGNSAFEGCALEAVVITDNVVSIGEKAFYNNDNLIVVVISGSVRTFGELAFGDCPNIDNFAFGDLAEELDVKNHVFSYEKNNETVDYTFKNMKDSTEYTFTDALAEKGTFDNRAYDMKDGKAVNVFLVTLDANGGECSDEYALTDENGVLTSELPIPTKDGCTFEGWYDGDEKVTVGYQFTENTSITAKWSGSQPSNNNAFVWIIVAIIIIVAALLMTVMVMSRRN